VRADGVPQDGLADATRRVFVGREAELGELGRGLSDALGGRGRLYLVSGEPGIGKTRLADELSELAFARGVPVLWGRCWEAGGAPAFWPWLDVLAARRRRRRRPRRRQEERPRAADGVLVRPTGRPLLRERGRPDGFRLTRWLCSADRYSPGRSSARFAAS
jgi:hypothetical protein